MKEEDTVLHIQLPGHPVTGPPVHSPEELVARMEVEDMEDEGDFFISDERVADKMETVEALLSLSSSTRSPGSSPEKQTLITILPAHNPDKGQQLVNYLVWYYLVLVCYFGRGFIYSMASPELGSII